MALVGDGCEERLPEPLELAISWPSLIENVLYEADRPFESDQDGSSLTRRSSFLFFLVASLDSEPLTLCVSESFFLTCGGFFLLVESVPEGGSGDPQCEEDTRQRFWRGRH